MTNYWGEVAALSAAFLWAGSSVAYSYIGQSVPPLLLNLSKGLIAIALILILLFFQQDFSLSSNLAVVGLLMLSGAIGIGLGDTFYLEALNILGARRTLAIESLAPPIAAILALTFLEEQLKLQNWLGILLTVLGVIWVVTEGISNPLPETAKHPLRGIILALLAAFGQGSGAVLSRAALAETTLSPLWSTLLRLVAAVVIILLVLAAQKQEENWLSPLYSKNYSHTGKSLFGIIFLTAFFSTFLGIWLQQTAFKYTQAGIAQSLLATSPLFVIPIALRTGERVSLRAILGAGVAIAGIILLFN